MRSWAFMIFVCTALFGQPAGPQLRQGFQNPPKAFRPMVRWWWPGGDVTDAELQREVRLLDEANFGGGEIQPFVIGLNPKMPAEARKRVNNYLTAAFFAHMRAALQEARSRGMWLDYTFGSGWPFGGGEAITPELASLELRSAHQVIQGPSKFHGKVAMPEAAAGMGAMVAKLSGVEEVLPQGWAERLRARSKLVAVVAVRGEEAEVGPRQQQMSVNPEGNVKKTGLLERGTAVNLTDRVRPDGTLDWDVPAGKWQVFAFKQFPADLRVIGGAGAGPQLVLDHLNRAAFAAHAQRVGDSAKQYVGDFFGNGLRAIFCDSLEVHAYLFWNDRFLEEFQKRRGYDLTPYLPVLKVPGFADPYGAFLSKPIYDIEGIGDRVRHDYWQTVSDLMFEEFYEPFNEWAAKNKLLARVQAHGAPADVMRIYGASDIPETEDLYNNGRYDFLKLAASAGHVYGHKIVSSESFVWMGKAYQTTPEKIKRYADELITAGINQIIYHGFPYEYMDRPEPGWHPFSSPLPFSSHMNQHNPFWPYIPRINAYITRLQYISQQGVNIAPVALYRSALSYDAVEPPEPEPEINTRLMAAGYNFDHINTDALLKSRVAQGRLVTPGGSRYSALVLQNEPQIPVELAEKLAAFAKGGLRIVFIGCVPQGESGLAGAGEKSAKVKQLMAAMRSVPSAEAAVAALSKSTQPNLRFTGASVPFIEKRVGAIDTFFFRNPDAEPREIQAEVAAAGSPEQWDAWTGGIQPFTAFTRQGKKVKLSLHLEPYGSALLAFDAAVRHKPAAAPSQAASAASVIEIGGSGWKFHGAGLAGDTGNLEIPKLLDWRSINALKSFSGRGLYETSFEATPEMLGGNRRLWLDLGDVKDVAEVKINGKPGPTLILRPYRADVTGLVQRGRNTLEITVINTLYNAIDARGGKINQFPGMAGLSSAQPMPSGLMGPVRIEVRR